MLSLTDRTQNGLLFLLDMGEVLGGRKIKMEFLGSLIFGTSYRIKTC
jgi:hypothetical protein